MPEFIIAKGLVEYPEALRTMQEAIEQIRQGAENGGENAAPERIWFLEHPPLYTAGTSAKDADLLESSYPVFKSQRGGQYTYHGPGQLVVYVMMNLKNRGNDIRLFVYNLEEWIIQSLKEFGINAVRKEGRIGVWLDDEKGERKIAAIGVRVTHGITWHGLSINVNPDLSHYKGIVPCGLKNYGVTSLQKEGITVPVPDVITIMQKTAEFLFN